MNIKGKTILLTGATGGIGQAIAMELAKAGAELILVSRDSEALLRLRQQLPGQHRVFSADITDEKALRRLQVFCQQQGALHGLINNAGISQFDMVAQQDYAAQIKVNLLAPMQLCQQLLPQLQQQADAFIVNVGSAFGSIGYPGFSGYCASKFGLRGFTEALKRELGAGKLQVLYFAPRATHTGINSAAVVAMNQQLGNQMDSPEQVAAALLSQLKASQSRRFLGWPEQLFVRLNALFPALVDKALQKKLAVIEKYAATKS
ncbi:SDR family oxidoreductase [Rheinheimera sp.]|uniref:SDR family oxidoreductase n=1 Tax=Rheinheimera sp. TaxID=1869214 RepID=UPI0027B8FD8D|nr:SDR family oxidoreductase [Rheinheimera sp.]